MDDGNGTVSLSCGEDSVALYKALCGTAAYDPANKFCIQDSLYNPCDGVIYDSAESFCYQDSLYSCGGTAYDPSMEICDVRDSQIYKFITIGNQTWMAQNLNYEYNRGSAKSYCYNDSAHYCAKFGRLYTWSAAMDSAGLFSSKGKGCGDRTTCSALENVRGACPEGFHLPYAGFGILTSVTGISIKSTSGWNNGGNGTDVYGFNALPAGGRNGDTGNFSGAGLGAHFWSSHAFKSNAWNDLASSLSTSDSINVFASSKSAAYSIRCIKD